MKQQGKSAEQGDYLREVTLSSVVTWPCLAQRTSSGDTIQTMIHLSSPPHSQSVGQPDQSSVQSTLNAISSRTLSHGPGKDSRSN
jgi:hypothetical protein